MPVKERGSQRLNRYFQEYAQYHQTAGNKLCHMFGIPLIIIASFGLLAQFELGTGSSRVDAGVLLAAVITLWYLTLDWKLAIPFGLVFWGLHEVSTHLTITAHWVVFVVGWIFQGIGHVVYEKKSPAFFKQLEHLLIGPLWIFARLIGRT